ncbi:MAG: MFS transporter, partial [Deltaproteobacteria bacterium]|nr:MFS transporter [Deltaproteobacteria bacterium]
VYGLSKAAAGRLLSTFAVGMIVGSPLQSFLSNRAFRGRKPAILLASVVTLGLTGLLAFATDRLSLPALYLVCLGLGMFPASIVVVGFTSAKELFPVQMAGTSTGLANVFPFAGGAVFQPLLGYLIERQGRIGAAFTLSGYRHAFLALFVAAAAALVAGLFLRETLAKDT